MSGSFDCVAWGGSGHHIRVYTSSGADVKERCYDSDSWYDGGFSATGRTVGATVSVSGNQEGIRVYVGGSDNKITEQCWDGDGWYQGDFTADGVEATAVSWDGGWGGLIFVRGADNKITEYRKVSGLWAPTGFSAEGIAIAATSVEGDGIRLYVVGTDHSITEYCSAGAGMVRGGFNAKGTDVAATSWKEGSTLCLRVYVKEEDGVIREHCWEDDGWSRGEFNVPAEEVAVTSWYYSTPDVFRNVNHIRLRVYTRESNNTVRERYWDGDGWHDGAYTGQAAHA